MPHLFRIGNRQALAPVAIAILLDQLSHQLDGLTSRRATLQSDTLQLLDHEHTVLIDQLLTPGDGGLTNAQLLLVQAGIGSVEKLEGSLRLRDRSLGDHAPCTLGILRMHTSCVNGLDRIIRIGSGRHDVHPSAVATVAGMAGNH